MFAFGQLEAKDKPEFYLEVASQVEHLISGEPNLVANLSNVSALLNLHLTDINWVGFYLWSDSDEELILGPFQGKPACIRIKSGRGVCGAAFENQTPVVVPDVMTFPGHIACDPDSRSEVVIPLTASGRAIGVLDIDSPYPNRFDEKDAKGLEHVCEVLMKGLYVDNLTTT